MLEKLFDSLPEWAKSKLLIRMIYTAASFVTARIVAFLTGAYLNHALQVAVLGLGKAGIHAVIQVQSVDAQVLQAFVTGLLMIGSEWLIQHFHAKVVLPNVAPETKPTGAPPTGLISALILTGGLLLYPLRPAAAWNPATDVQTNLKWTLGEEAALGTAYKVGGSGDVKVGQRGDSVMFGIFNYRFLKESYGAISNPNDGVKIGDGLKTGLMLNYFLGWFKSPQTPAMQFLNNVNIGPTVTIPLITDAHPLKHPSVWVEANFTFGGK